MISVIIPIFNEEKVIEKTLLKLKRLGDFETIVVDGGSLDGTLKKVRRFKGVKLLSYGKGRSSQMNHGAAISKGDILVFLHADTHLPENFGLHIESTIKEGYEGGAFLRKFDKSGLLLKMVCLYSNLFSDITKIFFGDQTIFVKRSLFDELRGFPKIEILEDCEFCRKWRGRKIKTIKHSVITSSRRFEKKGVLRTFMKMQWIKINYFLGIDTDKIKKGD